MLPSRELEEFVHQLKLSPQMLNPAVLFRLELQDQLFELSVFSADARTFGLIRSLIPAAN